MIFVGIDPGSITYAIAVVNELGELINYFEIPTDLIEKDAFRISKLIANYKPSAIALPSGHGLPFLRIRDIGDKQIFLLTLKDPFTRGPLREFLVSSKQFLSTFNAFTIPSAIELNSIPLEKKINAIDKGTADKVASAFFYRIYLRIKDFVLVELGRKFSAVLVVLNGKIIDGYGGTYLNSLNGEIAYLLHKYSSITKSTVYNIGNNLTLVKMIAEWYSNKYNIPIIVSGSSKDVMDIGNKYDFKFKESAIGSAYIANAYFGGSLYKYLEEGMLESSGTPISYVRLDEWKEVTSWIETL
ncbi:DUF1464 domain-containing protein [Sulfolobus sp. A20-N-F6]|nr:DUF1464 domain-containing protein [Sulfolobus sp. A20-N-F6]